MSTQTFSGRAVRSDDGKYVCLRKLKVAKMCTKIVIAFSEAGGPPALTEALRKEAIKQAHSVIFKIKQSIEISKHDVCGH